MAVVSTAAAATPEDPDELTIDQLAARVGMTVRNVRAYAARGLIAPPRLVGRTGYYGPQHVARLTLVREMLAEGYSLSMIERTLSHAPATSSVATLALHRAMVAPWLQDEPEEMDTAEIASRAGVDEDPWVADELAALGVIEKISETRVRVLDPATLAAGLQVVTLGISPRQLIPAQNRVIAHCYAIAEIYVEMFRETAWADYQADEGVDPARLAEMQRLMEQLQPVAAQAVLASFRTAMARTVQRHVQAELQTDGSGDSD